MKDSSHSKRRHPRVALTLPVAVSSIDPDLDPGTGRPLFRSAQREMCHNLSMGGAYLRTHDTYAPGRRLLIEMELPSGRSFETVGRVAWSRSVVSPGGVVESGCGVEFIDTSGEHGSTLHELISIRTR